MEMIQEERKHIQQQEYIIRLGVSLLGVTAFLVPASFVLLLPKFPNPFIQLLVSIFFHLFPCSAGLLCFLILGLGLCLLGPYMMKVEQQRKRWLDMYGRHVLAMVSKRPWKDAVVIGERAGRRHASSLLYLNWEDPETSQRYSFLVSTRFYTALEGAAEGTLFPVQFDPTDPSFFMVPKE